MVTLAFVNVLTLIATASLIAVAMLLAWRHFGAPRFALLWALASIGAALQWAVALLGLLFAPGWLLPVAVSGALIVANSSLLAIGARDLHGRALHLPAFAVAAGFALALIILSLFVLENRAVWAVGANVYVAAMMIVAAFGVLPPVRAARAPDAAGFAVFAAFALFAVAVAIVSLDFGADGAGPGAAQVRILIPAILPGLYAAFGIASVFLLAARLNEQVEALVMRDALTGTLNRRGLEASATGLIADARRTGRALTAAVTDIDHLKLVNDRYGHAAGDRVLVAFSDCVQAAVRDYDLFGRLGGDRFCLLLVDAGEAEASEIVERARAEVERMVVEGAPGTSVTASFGIATLAPGDIAFSAVLQRAETALDIAKQAGRNFVAIDPPPALAAE